MTVINYNNAAEKIFLSDGIFLISAGLIIIYLSQISEFIFTMIFSFGLFFIGLTKLINSIIMRKNISMPFLSIISACLILVLGVYLIFNAIFDPVFLITGTIMYLLMDSLVSYSTAAESFGKKQVFLIGIFTGFVQLALAAAVFYSSPFYGLWISGLAMGLNFVFAGIISITKFSYSNNLAYCRC